MQDVGQMIELIRSPWEDTFKGLLRDVVDSLVVASPYVGAEPCGHILAQAEQRSAGAPPSLLLLTDLSADALMSGATNVAAIAGLVDALPATDVRFLPSIHAKVYVADSKTAILTSANMTMGGLRGNIEYGVKLSEPGLVARVRRDITDYAALGTRMNLAELRFLTELSADIRGVVLEAGRTLNGKARRQFQRRLRAFQDDLLRVRAAGRAPHAIFADAIVYLLQRRPMSTRELHTLVQTIHPDLCDDTVDRVIDGAHFGKKWKHAVRTAQQHLKRKGLIELSAGQWRLTQA